MPLPLMFLFVTVGLSGVVAGKVLHEADRQQSEWFGYDPKKVVLGVGAAGLFLGSPVIAAVGVGLGLASWLSGTPQNGPIEVQFQQLFNRSNGPRQIPQNPQWSQYGVAMNAPRPYRTA